MKNTNLEDLKEAYFQLKELLTKSEAKMANHRSIPPFSYRKAFHSQADYDEYILQHKEWNKANDDRIQDLKMCQFDIELKEKEVLELIPLKAVWFNLPGTSIYLAKTSSNTMDRDGRNLHCKDFTNAYEVGPNGHKMSLTITQIEGLLPKLETL